MVSAGGEDYISTGEMRFRPHMGPLSRIHKEGLKGSYGSGVVAVNLTYSRLRRYL